MSIAHFIKQGIINPEDIQKFCEDAKSQGLNTVFLDTSFVLPTSPEDVFENYNKERIPNARFFDIKGIADKTSPHPHMLPPRDEFEQSMSALGLNADDTLILYAQHSITMGAARVWWMLRGFGHENVLVLNGGLPAYKAAGLPLETSSPSFYAPTSYKAKDFNTAMVTDMAHVISVSKNSLCPILDARPQERFNGTSPEPRANMRAGHIPNSLNLPASALLQSNGRLKSKDELADLIYNALPQLKTEQQTRIILSCGSGITACALALVLFMLGHENFCVYDGSWSEWGLENSPTPVATAIE